MKKDHKGPIEHSIEIAIETIENLLTFDYSVSKRTIAILLLQEDDEIKQIVKEKEPHTLSQIEEITEEVKSHYANPLSYEFAVERQNEITEIIKKVVRIKKERISFREKLSRLTMNPVTGLPILFFVLYWGLYKFVGDFGVGTVVDFIEGTIFEKHINPFITGVFINIIPWKVLQDLFVGEYGVITLGMRYAVALILPIATFFFLIFSACLKDWRSYRILSAILSSSNFIKLSSSVPRL